MVTQMIGVGEATGAMDAMLQKIADFYEDEVDAATKDMLTMLEPIMIVLLGIMHRRHRDFALHAAVLDDCETGGLNIKTGGRVRRSSYFLGTVARRVAVPDFVASPRS